MFGIAGQKLRLGVRLRSTIRYSHALIALNPITKTLDSHTDCSEEEDKNRVDEEIRNNRLIIQSSPANAFKIFSRIDKNIKITTSMAKKGYEFEYVITLLKQKDAHVYSVLIAHYIKSDLTEARRLFEEAVHAKMISIHAVSVMIEALPIQEAIKLFASINTLSLIPDCPAFTIIIKRLLKENMILSAHAHYLLFKSLRIKSSESLDSQILILLTKSSELPQAQSYFDEIKLKNSFHYSILMYAYINAKKYHKVVDLYRASGEDEYTRVYMVIASLCIPSFKGIHPQLYEKTFTYALEQYTLTNKAPLNVVWMYKMIFSIIAFDKGNRYFTDMYTLSIPHSTIYNTLINPRAHPSHMKRWFRRIKRDRICLTTRAFKVLINALMGFDEFEVVETVCLYFFVSSGLSVPLDVQVTMVDYYSKTLTKSTINCDFDRLIDLFYRLSISTGGSDGIDDSSITQTGIHEKFGSSHPRIGHDGIIKTRIGGLNGLEVYQKVFEVYFRSTDYESCILVWQAYTRSPYFIASGYKKDLFYLYCCGLFEGIEGSFICRLDLG